MFILTIFMVKKFKQRIVKTTVFTLILIIFMVKKFNHGIVKLTIIIVKYQPTKKCSN